ncbi:MAG: MFS transporter [Eubacteriaceae bacterium]
MKVNKLSVFSIMSIFFIAMGVGTITPAIANIAAAFPEIEFTTILLVSTLPSLILIPATLITGAVAGKKVKYKTLCLLGLALFSIGGMAPVIFNSSFNVVLISRAIFGISLGIISPLGNAMIMGIYEGQARANMLGIGGFVMNLGGIVLQFLGGALSGISWELAFLGHSPAIISFFLVLLFLKEPEAPQMPEGMPQSTEKEKVGPMVYILSLGFGIAMMFNYPMLVNFSSIMEIKQIPGGATAAALALSMFTVGGAISGTLFGKAYQKLGRFILPVAFIGAAVGIALVAYGNSALVLTLGTFTVGLFFMLSMPAIMMLIGMYTPPSTMAMAISLMMAIMNAFAFCSTYWIGLVGSITGDVFLMPIKIAVVAFAIFGALLIFVNVFPKEVGAPE